VRYLGSFYGHRSPIPLLRALHRLHEREPQRLAGVRFELVGNVSPRLRHHAAWRGLPDGLVRQIGTVPYSRSLAMMSEADLLLVIDAPDQLSVFLPSKLVEYLGAGVPVLGIVPPGASAKLVEAVGGLVANPREPDAVARTLCAALDQARTATTPWGDPAVRARYRLDRVAADFMRELKTTAAT